VKNILETALDILVKLGYQPDPELLRSPSLRARVNHGILKDAIELNAVYKFESNGRSLVKGTIEHNLDALISNGGSLDRGASLTELCLSDLPGNQLANSRVLHLGCRNLNEILCSISHGVTALNVVGLDLISYHSCVHLGDMHQLPFPDYSFDIVVAGWVIGYSRVPALAIGEILRVLTPNGRIAIGWDFNSCNYYGDRGHLTGYDQPYVESCDSILTFMRQAGLDNHKVLYRRDPIYPYDAWGRQCILVVEKGNRQLKIRSRNKHSEAQGVEYLRNEFITHPDESISERLKGHLSFIANGDTATQHYLLMRHHYVKYGSVIDDLLSKTISMHFPPILSNEIAFKSQYFGQHSRKQVEQIVDTLREEGIYRFPVLLNTDVVDRLRNALEWMPSSTARRSATEISILSNPTAQSLWLDEVLISISEIYFGSVPILDFLAATRTIPFESQTELSLDADAQMWHFDKDRVKFLKVFIYLSDVDLNAGPHEFIFRTHRVKPRRDGRLSDIEVVNMFSEYSKAVLCGPAGTVFIEDTHGLHRGTPVLAGERTLFQIEYTNSLFGQALESYPLDLFLPRFEEQVDKMPRLFERFTLD